MSQDEPTFTSDQLEMADTVNGPWQPYQAGKPMLRYARVKPDIWEAWLKRDCGPALAEMRDLAGLPPVSDIGKHVIVGISLKRD